MTNPFAAAFAAEGETATAEAAVTYNPKFEQKVLESTHENVTDKVFYVDFKIPPRKGRRLSHPGGEEYTQFGWATGTDAYINAYLFFGEKWLQPHAIVRAAVTLRKKARADGREFLYAELRPTSKEPTYRMFIGGDNALENSAENAEIFLAYDPIPGGISMTPVQGSGTTLASLPQLKK